MSPWHLFLLGHHSQAFDLWDENLAAGALRRVRLQRGMAWLLSHEADRALKDFAAERIVRPGRYYDPWVGIALWQSGRLIAACRDWAEEIDRLHRREIDSVDTAGGVEVPAILWSASAHPRLREWRRPADKELRQRWRTQRCQRSRWPGTIAGFLLGERSAEDLLTASASSAEVLQHRQRAEAHFFLGASALDCGDSAGYQRHLELAVRENPIPIDAAYYLARAELERLTGQRLPVPVGDWSAQDRTRTP